MSNEPDDPAPVPLHRLVCHRCQRPITKGQAYANVRLPDQTTVPVHGTCMETKR